MSSFWFEALCLLGGAIVVGAALHFVFAAEE